MRWHLRPSGFASFFSRLNDIVSRWVRRGARRRMEDETFSAMYDKLAVFSRSAEGVIVDRAITVGGCSVVFSGTSFDPPDWLQGKIGMDLRPAADRIKKEIGIARFSEEFTRPWVGTRKLREAASDLGLDLTPQEKFIREDRCKNGRDGCMTGCRNGAKWTAREWIDDAVSHGATLLPEADVSEIIIENGRATGVEALYVCDASVFPRSPGRPPTLMILALVTEFSRKLIAA